jgi:hypothetical protein
MDWVEKLNNQMHRTKWHIMFIMDNVLWHILLGNDHKELEGFDTIHLSNMLILFLPKNTTLVMQPLDTNIICLKVALQAQVMCLDLSVSMTRWWTIWWIYPTSNQLS